MRRQPPPWRRTCGAFAVAFASTFAACGDGSDRAYRGRSARQWASQLSASSTRDRIAAAEALYHIAPRSNEVVVALVAAMRDTSGEVQSSAAVALSTVGVRAVPGLIEALGDDHESVRMIALTLLAERGADAAPAAPAIARLLADVSEQVRLAAAQALQRIGPAARDAEPSLLKAARQGSPSLRAAALQALIANDAEPQPLTPVLERALHDSIAAIRSAAVKSAVASRILPTDALAMIIPLTNDRDATVRQAAFRGLGRLLGSPNTEARARALLLKGTTDSNTTVRDIARRALTPVPVGNSEQEPRRTGAFPRGLPQ